MYIATCFIGRDYTPGEIIPDTLPKETLDRLLASGAIRESAPFPEPVTGQADGVEPELDAGPDEEPEVDAVQSDEAMEPEDEIDDEAEAPEIDVMDGLISAPAEEKPAETAAPKRAAKAAKGGKAR